jgi:hypothetical protein
MNTPQLADWYETEIAVLKAERDRLRTALEEIALERKLRIDRTELIEIARRALEGK